MAKNARVKEMDEKLRVRINETMDAADKAAQAAGESSRVGTTSNANAALIAALAEELLTWLPPAKRLDGLGNLNEILCYLSAADKAINPRAPEAPAVES